MSLASDKVYLGNSKDLDLPTGYELRAARQAGSSVTNTDVTSVSGIATFSPSELGRYYLFTREDAASNWCPVGMIEVIPLVNVKYEAVCLELETVNALLANRRQREVADACTRLRRPTVPAAKRMNVRGLHKHRADLEARKVAFERVSSGRLPLRFN